MNAIHRPATEHPDDDPDNFLAPDHDSQSYVNRLVPRPILLGELKKRRTFAPANLAAKQDGGPRAEIPEVEEYLRAKSPKP